LMANIPKERIYILSSRISVNFLNDRAVTADKTTPKNIRKIKRLLKLIFCSLLID